MNALSSLLSNVIDYAGLFPPASLRMEESVRNYSAYLTHERSWMLGRLIIPISRLAEFDRCLHSLVPPPDAGRWRIAVLASSSQPDDLKPIHAFYVNGIATIDTIELKASTAHEISGLGIDFGSLTAYVEIPLDPDPTDLVALIGRTGIRAKVRMGGITEDMFPKSADVIRFITACVRAGVPFKATAGLHHPVRAYYRLTYDKDSSCARMYGFLNLLLATGFVFAGMGHDDACRVLEEEDARAFVFDREGVTWRNNRLPVELITKARKASLVAIGSCSFAEPVDELRALGLL
jgi:hypothetical protein